jgi:hypothetical protein
MIAARTFVLLLSAWTAEGPGVPASASEFARRVRPILADKCFPCHGPDQKRRKADLRLDEKEEVFGNRGGYRIVVPGKPGESELVRRITADDPAERMPPVQSGVALSAAEKALLTQWIAEGAPWQVHWAFIPPKRPPVPLDSPRAWQRGGLDGFVAARLRREGLTPSPQADRATLIRRLTLDLTGLPPSPNEVDAFARDDSPDAYLRLVDRLLASPRFGERMAAVWLDAARYADTSGYQTDGPRDMWRWRDWVIDAINRNQPFNQFTIEQLAGDLLPEASLDQRIATGFNRNHRGNSEGGIIPEEFRVEYVADRVDTTATVWLGLTLGCARCHDHKYDPITQREYYQFFAYFNNVPENGRAIKEGNSPPFISAPTPFQRDESAALAAQLQEARNELDRLGPRIASLQAAWEGRLIETLSRRALPASLNESFQSFPDDGLVAHFPLDGAAVVRPPEKPCRVLGNLAFTAGIHGMAAAIDEGRLEAADVGKFGYFDRFTLSAWIRPADVAGGTILSRMLDEEEGEGYSLQFSRGKIQVNLVKRWLDDAIRVETTKSLEPNRWHHLAFTYDGLRLAKGVNVYVDGEPAMLTVLLDAINQSFETNEPFRIGGGPGDRFRGQIDDVRVYARVLERDEVSWLAAPRSLLEIMAQTAPERTGAESGKLRAFFLNHAAPPEIKGAVEHVVRLARRQDDFRRTLPTVMVMEELPTPRRTYLLQRGEYDKPGEPLGPGVPAVLPPLPENAPPNRLGLANWLVDPANPLTARVTVNRLWQSFFGTGLVTTTEDFGTQGEAPIYAELLDWLACELIESGWDVKALVRRIVTSGTYRQRSSVSSELSQRDPQNRLYARGPRYRWSAEVIRDQALAASGLLVERLGGPSVRPYQPVGLWQEIATDTDYRQDTGAALYRRSLYTFWKRTVSPPNLATFDASTRETCSVRPQRTNTPLQALVLMNDTTFVEAARALAARVLAEAAASVEARIVLAFRLVLARSPSRVETAILTEHFRRQFDFYRENPEAARQLCTVGQWPKPAAADDGELAAYCAVCSLILNLDEAVTKN